MEIKTPADDQIKWNTEHSQNTYDLENKHLQFWIHIFCGNFHNAADFLCQTYIYHKTIDIDKHIEIIMDDYILTSFTCEY